MNEFQKKLNRAKRRFGLPLFAAAVVVAVSWVSMDQASALYILTGTEDDAAIVLDDSAKVGEISSKLVYLSSGKAGYDLALTSKQKVTITHDGKTVTVQSKQLGETVSELLDRMDITPSPLEMVAVDVSGGDVTLTVTSELTYYEEVTEEVEFETVHVPNAKMTEGTEKVIQEGKDGVRTAVYEVVMSGGQEITRQFVEDRGSTVQDEIIEYGTAKKPAPAAPAPAVSASRQGIVDVAENADGSGTLTLADGTTLNFSGARNMTATAYTAGHGGADHTTATGTFVRVGTVAVDKRVIPLGTRMYIVSNDGSVVYGMAVAEDTGVRGNVVDLYFDTYQQCINFGRRSCTVYILE